MFPYPSPRIALASACAADGAPCAAPVDKGMHPKRAVEQVVFVPHAAAPVLEWMDRLSHAHDGWINLLPGVPDEEVEERGGGFFSVLFGSAQPPVSMCTWMPGRGQAPAAALETVGIMHPGRGRAGSLLTAAGVAVPSSWRVRQDHVRRGMILHPLPGAPHGETLAWMLRAGAALAIVPLTGSWQAAIYLPRATGARGPGPRA